VANPADTGDNQYGHRDRNGHNTSIIVTSQKHVTKKKPPIPFTAEIKEALDLFTQAGGFSGFGKASVDRLNGPDLCFRKSSF
jgi:hypothetical protein